MDLFFGQIFNNIYVRTSSGESKLEIEFHSPKLIAIIWAIIVKLVKRFC